MKNLATLTRLAATQHGVVSLTQSSLCGIGRPEWRALCRDGLIVPLFRDVGRLAGAPDTPLATIKGGVLSVGGGTMASHTSGAAVWAAPCVGTNPVHVMVDDRSRRATIEGLVLHRPTDRRDLEPIIRDRIPTTRPLRTLVDLGAVAPDAVAPALHHFIAGRLFTPAAAWEALRVHRASGHGGIAALEAALCGLDLGHKPPDSILETTMAGLFQRYALPAFEFHAVVAGFEVDFLITATPVVVETDGWEYHGLDSEQFERDREKDALLGEAGYIVRRFTWRQVTKKPAWVADRIEGTLRRWAPHALAG